MALVSITLTSRYVPPETYIHAAKLSTKVIILLTFIIIITVILAALTCYCCCQRRIWRLRARRIARAKAREMDLESDLRAGRKPRGFKSGKRGWRFWESEARKGDGLGARIHRRNARFYAPGLSRERREVHNLEMQRIRALEVKSADVEEIRRPGKVFARWKREMGA
jgi:hypothetical protein